MALGETWDEGDLGDQRQDQIDDLIESTRIAVRERAAVEHQAYADETGYTDVWRHTKTAGRSNYGLAASKPSTEATGLIDGALYYETDTGLLVKYNSTSEAWVTVGGPNHSTAVTTYGTGTVAVTNDNAVVTGTETVWSTNLTTGSIFLGPDGEYYAITSVDGNTQITLDRVYAGSTASGQSYTAYLDGHPQYLGKGGGTINGNAAIGGTLGVTGAVTLAAAMAMGTNKITGLDDGTASDDAMAFGQLAVTGFALGTYSGDAVYPTSITGVGFQPTVLVVYSHTSNTSSTFHRVIWKTSQDGANIKASNGGWLTGYISTLDADGFTITGNMNRSGVDYTYIALG